MPRSLYALKDLTIEDERAFRSVPLYPALKAALLRDGYRFRVLPRDLRGRWDRALFLNLTYWSAGDGADVLCDTSIPADVVTHAAWHHLAARALGPMPQSPAALFLGESIASAFDLYLVGHLLGRRGRSSFLETQVPAMAETASAAGLGPAGFRALLDGVAADPEAAFESLRRLLFDATMSLYASADAEAALASLARLRRNPYAPLLHRFELSTWVLFARAHGARRKSQEQRAVALDAKLRRGRHALRDLADAWLPDADGGSTS